MRRRLRYGDGVMMTKIVVFTRKWLDETGDPVIRLECRASVEGQQFDGVIEWEIGTYNPWPGRQMRNVVAQYQRGRASFLAGDGDAWLTFEHDMALPDARIRNLLEQAEATLVLADDPQWCEWSLEQLDRCGQQAPLVINPIILAEISPRFERAADLEAALLVGQRRLELGAGLARQPPGRGRAGHRSGRADLDLTVLRRCRHGHKRDHDGRDAGGRLQPLPTVSHFDPPLARR